MPDRPDIEAIKARRAAALVSGYDAAQEWRCKDDYVFFGDYADEGEPDLLIRVLSAETPEAVARFIAHAPEDIDALVAEVERLRTALERIATQCVPEDHLAVLIARAALYPEEPSGGD